MLVNIKLDSCIKEDMVFLKAIFANGMMIDGLTASDLDKDDTKQTEEEIFLEQLGSSSDVEETDTEEPTAVETKNDFLPENNPAIFEEEELLTRSDIRGKFSDSSRLTDNFFAKLQTGFYGHENVLIVDAEFVNKKTKKYRDPNVSFKVMRALKKLKRAPRRLEA